MLICTVWSVFLVFYYRKKIQTLKKEMENQSQNMKLQMVTSQISPHFILNTLGAIRSMIRINPEQAYELLYDFSKYIRNKIQDKDYMKPIPFGEEMDYIDTYLKLEKLRFGDRIKVVKDFQTGDFFVLPLTIQPFVENAVKHGLMMSKKGGTIWMSTRKTDGHIYIEIKDDGIGFDLDKMEENIDRHKSIGLKSAMFRLQHEMGAGCDIQSKMDGEDHGTRVLIDLPIKRGGKLENNNCR